MSQSTVSKGLFFVVAGVAIIIIAGGAAVAAVFEGAGREAWRELPIVQRVFVIAGFVMISWGLGAVIDAVLRKRQE